MPELTSISQEGKLESSQTGSDIGGNACQPEETDLTFQRSPV